MRRGGGSPKQIESSLAKCNETIPNHTMLGEHLKILSF